jgi:hypothetical protein
VQDSEMIESLGYRIRRAGQRADLHRRYHRRARHQQQRMPPPGLL